MTGGLPCSCRGRLVFQNHLWLDRHRPVEYQVAGLELRAPQRERENFSQIFDEVYVERLANVLRQVVEIALVLQGEYDGTDPRAHCAEHLLLHAADREDP